MELLPKTHINGDSELERGLDAAAAMLRSARKVAALTGAGISAESGVPTFRGAGGLWEGHRVEDVATPRAFEADSRLVWRFYNMRRAALAGVKPNAGHLALAELEQRLGERFTLITQNVDGLHHLAGSKNVLEIHGAIRRARCTGCGLTEDRGCVPLADLPTCATCGAILRPDVVWFEEMLPIPVWPNAELAVKLCQCLMVVGTSALVYPAAGLIDKARSRDAKIIEINLTSTPATTSVDVSLQGPSGMLLPELLKRL